MNELKRLDDEFDLTNPTDPELNVALEIFLANHITFDPFFDVGDFAEKIGCRIFRIDERLMFSQKFIGQFATAADSARFD